MLVLKKRGADDRFQSNRNHARKMEKINIFLGAKKTALYMQLIALREAALIPPKLQHNKTFLVEPCHWAEKSTHLHQDADLHAPHRGNTAME